MKQLLILLVMAAATMTSGAQIIEQTANHPTGYIDGYDGYASIANMKYITVDGVLYSAYSENSDYWTLVKYPANREATTYTVHNRCYRIARGAFEGARNLQVINIPRQVRYIGDNAFDGCSALKAINYGDDNGSYVEEISDDTQPQELARFNVAGQQCQPDEKGVQIIVYSNGTAKTVVVN